MRLRAALLGSALALALSGSAGAATGDIYVPDEDAGTLFRLSPAGGNTAEEFASDPGAPGGPSAVAFLPNFDLLLADEDDGRLFQVNGTSGALTTFATLAVIGIQDVSVHPDGRVIAADGSEDLYAINQATRAVSTYLSLPAGASGAAFEIARDGTTYIADGGATPRILRASPSGSITTLSSSPLILAPDKVALSADQSELFVTSFDQGGSEPGSLLRVDTATGATDSLVGVSAPRAVATMTDGSLLVADVVSDTISRVSPSGGPPSLFSSDPDFLFPRDIAIEPPRCAGRPATAVGTTRRDVLSGSAFADIFVGLGGNDVIRGLGGRDLICGGKGRDRLLGGRGRDRLLGGPGRDRLLGGPGRDRLFGGKGRDLLRGGPGRDRQKQ